MAFIHPRVESFGDGMTLGQADRATLRVKSMRFPSTRAHQALIRFGSAKQLCLGGSRRPASGKLVAHHAFRPAHCLDWRTSRFSGKCASGPHRLAHQCPANRLSTRVQDCTATLGTGQLTGRGIARPAQPVRSRSWNSLSPDSLPDDLTGPNFYTAGLISANAEARVRHAIQGGLVLCCLMNSTGVSAA